MRLSDFKISADDELSESELASLLLIKSMDEGLRKKHHRTMEFNDLELPSGVKGSFAVRVEWRS